MARKICLCPRNNFHYKSWRVPPTLLHIQTPFLSFLLHFHSSSSSSSSSSMEATPSQPNQPKAPGQSSSIDIEGQKNGVKVIDYSKRSQWLRAAVLGANDGILSIASLMMGVGAVRKDSKTMVLTGVAGLIAGACSMAIGEFVSVYSQYDIELSQMKRENKSTRGGEEEEGRDQLPNPWHAALASALAFAVGALVPLLGAVFIRSYVVRLVVITVVVSVALLGFGGLAAVLGGAHVVKSSLRMLIGGWLAMGITFGLTKSIGSTGI